MDNYLIVVKGYIDSRRSRFFDGLALTELPGGNTQIRGRVDQAALFAALSRIRDLGLPLLLVKKEEEE